MMKIHMKTLPILWINLEIDTYRFKEMVEMFSKYGLTNHHRISAVQGKGENTDDIVASGCAMSHVKALKYALECFPEDTPVLILEDDAEIMQNMELEFNIPIDSECVYLGISHWGINATFAYQSRLAIPTKADIYDNKYYRISGMLSTHAILYVSSSYKHQAIQRIEQSSWHCDIELANYQHFNKIYTPIKPFFYQRNDPNRSVTFNPLFMDENGTLKPNFTSWWFEHHKEYYLSSYSELQDIIISN